MISRHSVLVAATVLTGLFGLLAVGLAFFGPVSPNPAQLRLLDSLITLFTAGALTIFALLNSSSNRRQRH